MSDAKKCDRCGSLYEVRKGVVDLDVRIAKGGAGPYWSTWEEVDFCPACSKIVLAAIGKAIQR